MKKTILILLLIGLLLTTITTVGAITNGVPDGNAHPGAGAIIGLPVSAGGSNFVVCSGVLVHPRVLLTAGHCTDFIQQAIDAGIITLSGNVRVTLDTANALHDGHMTVTALYTHPNYWSAGPETGNMINDVGVLILAQPANAPVVPLPPAGILDQLQAAGALRNGSDGADFAVVGYGRTLAWPPPQGVAPDGIRRQAVSEFLNLRSTWLHMSQNQAPGNGNGGSCYGDSGGPVFYIEPGGAEILVALTSWGDNPCVATGTAWRVDIPVTLDFVNSILDGLQ